MIALFMSREVARIILLFSDYSDRFIEKITSSSHQTIGKIRWNLIELGVEWKDLELLTGTEFRALLYTKMKRRIPYMVLPDFDEAERQLKKPHKQRK